MKYFISDGTTRTSVSEDTFRVKQLQSAITFGNTFVHTAVVGPHTETTLVQMEDMHLYTKNINEIVPQRIQ